MGVTEKTRRFRACAHYQTSCFGDQPTQQWAAVRRAAALLIYTWNNVLWFQDGRRMSLTLRGWEVWRVCPVFPLAFEMPWELTAPTSVDQKGREVSTILWPSSFSTAPPSHHRALCYGKYETNNRGAELARVQNSARKNVYLWMCRAGPRLG